MNMKRVFVLVLALAMLFSLAACGKNPSNTGGTGTPQTSTPNQSGTPESSGAPSTQSGTTESSGAPSTQSGGETSPGKIVDCAGVADFYEKLVDGMYKKVMALQDEHNDAAGDDFTKLVNLWYMPFSSLRYVDAASFTAGTSAAAVQSAFRLMDLEDAVITENEKEFTITYTATNWPYSEDTYAFKEVIRYDPDAPALSVVKYRDGEISSFTEFQALGNDQYALSSELERAIVTYKDGEVLAMDHAENRWEINSDTGEHEDYSFVFSYDSGRIFGRTDLNHEWVMEAQTHDALYRHYDLQDGVCTITGLKKELNWNGGPPTFTPGYELILP